MIASSEASNTVEDISKKFLGERGKEMSTRIVR